MDAVRLSTLGAVALASPRAVQSFTAPVNLTSGSGVQNLAAGLTQGLFQQALQASASALTDGNATPDALGLNTVPSLLAALAAPQAAVAPDTSAAATAATATTTTAATPAVPVPAAQSLDAAQAAAPTATALAADTGTALPDTTGSGLDFALQTALRFGAGVGPLGTPLDLVPDLATGPVRDAVAVQRAAAVRAQAGGPGPEAFARSPFALPALPALRAYQAAALPAPTGGGLDLLA